MTKNKKAKFYHKLTIKEKEIKTDFLKILKVKQNQT